VLKKRLGACQFLYDTGKKIAFFGSSPNQKSNKNTPIIIKIDTGLVVIIITHCA